ncbi:hypothetical protein L6164_001957 [Bauhinia variegata]|uniref:Uncharacterized protein n=1 Tax=Bauhinia variegata TaxID=167791 RepID=A0ACB9QEK8_BAUVA|nr:hypothetical protein L6164_001957 [Bauhinia variegata]
MAGKRSAKTNPSQARKRVEAVDTKSASTLVRGKDGSAFARCGECNKDVPVALISMHSCSLEAKIKMNLDAQVVEKHTEVKKPEETKKSKSKEPKAKRAKVEKEKKKDPNAPKRPVTSFFIFLEEFRKEYKEANPDAKGVKGVAKEAGEKWKSMTDEEKKAYHDKAAELKAEYEKAMEAYNAEDEAPNVDEGSDKESEEKEVAEDEKSDKEAEEKEVEEDEKSDKGAVANELEEVADEE